MNEIRVIILMFNILCLQSCQSQSEKDVFYSQTQVEDDVWRFPIIYPYELMTAYCCVDWTVNPNTELAKLTKPYLGVDSCNYIDGYIILHDKLNDEWWVADVEKKESNKFQSKSEAASFLSQKNILFKVYSIKELFEHWHLTKDLPWRTFNATSSE